jgi:hypothetical protein
MSWEAAAGILKNCPAETTVVNLKQRQIDNKPATAKIARV